MTILSEQVDVVIGIDSHKQTHTAAIVTANGAHQATVTIPTTPAGFEQLHRQAVAAGNRRCWAIEGCGSYGHGLVAWLHERGERVIEVDRPKRPKRRMGRKTDEIDAVRAAREALTADRHGTPRAHGRRDALAAAHAARRSAITAATDAERQLLAFVVTAPEHLAAKLRGHTTHQIVSICARWRPDIITDPSTRTIATTMRRVARRITDLRDEADEHQQVITAITAEWRPDLLRQVGVGPIVAGVVLAAWSHPGRIHSEGAFAMIAGCAPIPASSGLTDKHRLNPFGDRQLNAAIHVIYLTRMRQHPPTQAYIERRRAQGKTARDIRRCVKRYIARELFQLLEHPS